MRSLRCPAAALVLALAAAAAADEARPADELKKKAAASWEGVTETAPAVHLTKHFVICAPEPMAKRLKDVGDLLEKHHDRAKEALKFELKEEDKGEVLPGPVAVYLFADRDQFKAFVRRVEGRRLLPEETSSHRAGDDKLHVAAGPPRGKQGPPAEIQACQEVASLLLARRAGVRTPLPDWLVSGFGRATYYRVAPRDKAVLADRALAAGLARKRSIADVWDGKIDADEADALQASLADFLAYGPGARSFPRFLAGFAPEENVERKTTAQAFDAARLKPERVAEAWKKWAPAAR